MRVVALVILALIFTLAFFIDFVLISWLATDNNQTFNVSHYISVIFLAVATVISWYVLVRRLPKKIESLYVMAGYLVLIGSYFLFVHNS